MIDVTITGSGRWNLLKRTIKSFKEHVHCSEEFRFLVTDDAGYKKMNRGDKSPNKTREKIVSSGLFDKWFFSDVQDYGDCVKWLFSNLKSEFYFHLQDDWEFLIDVDLDSLIHLMRKKPTINHIRFMKRTIRPRMKSEIWNNLGKLSKTNVEILGIKLVAAPYWAMHPSLSRTSFVQKIPLPSKKQDRTHKPGRWERYWLQNVFKGIDRTNYKDYSKNAGTYIFGQIGDPPTILHIGGEQRALKHRKRVTLDERTEDHKNIV